jgi:hypothetical protein
MSLILQLVNKNRVLCNMAEILLLWLVNDIYEEDQRDVWPSLQREIRNNHSVLDINDER